MERLKKVWKIIFIILRVVLSVVGLAGSFYWGYRFFELYNLTVGYNPENKLKPPGDPMLGIYGLLGIACDFIIILVNIKWVIKYIKKRLKEAEEEYNKKQIEKFNKRDKQ